MTLCYSVRVESLVSISRKAFIATGFDGSSDIIPKSQVFGQDLDVEKCEAYWISAWILSKKKLQYSSKKQGFFDNRNGKIVREDIVRHYPDRKEPVESNEIAELKR